MGKHSYEYVKNYLFGLNLSLNSKNYDGQWHGPVQIRYALGNSFNIPAVNPKSQFRRMVYYFIFYYFGY